MCYFQLFSLAKPFFVSYFVGDRGSFCWVLGLVVFPARRAGVGVTFCWGRNSFTHIACISVLVNFPSAARRYFAADSRHRINRVRVCSIWWGYLTMHRPHFCVTVLLIVRGAIILYWAKSRASGEFRASRNLPKVAIILNRSYLIPLV